MPSVEVHSPNSAPVIVSVGAIIYSAIQAELIVAFLCAVLGAGFGLAFMPAPAPTQSKVELFLRFAGNTGYIVITAVMTMFIMHMNLEFFANMYPWSFFIGFSTMIGKDFVVKGFLRLIDVAFSGVEKLIDRKLGNIGDDSNKSGDK